MSPFQHILGDGFFRLPEPVQRLHSLSRKLTTTGRAEIVAARGFLPWLTCRLAGLPRSGSDVPVTVDFCPDGEGGEYWCRRFATRRYASRITVGGRGRESLLLERFFPFRLYYRLTPGDDGLAWRLVEWRLGAMPLPRRTLPVANCFESGEEGRFRFNIDAAFPIIGPVIHYRGWLVPVEETAGR